jgi:predicted KAP-like P-loop ATPase
VTNTNNLHAAEWLSADRPIESQVEDTLGRRNFSEALAAAIRGWSGKESLVLALYGGWGSGKSSIKNMVIESMGLSSPGIRSVDFNPWQLANRPSLSEAFFDELGLALGKGELGTNRQKRATLNKISVGLSGCEEAGI